MPLNASRIHLERFVERAAASVDADALVLDAGAGDGAYRGHFARHRYESADFAQVDKPYDADITYLGDLAALPIDDDRFDLVLMTQVLEHLPDPLAVLRELRRVLKPGSQIWASCPLFYEEHEQPYDFYRYTQFGLRHLFERAGYAEIEIEWLEGYLATVGYELDVAARALPPRAGPLHPLRPLRFMLERASELAARSDVRRKRTDRGHPKNYTVVAVA